MSGALKEVRERIVSVKSTQQITKAMKMVSAAKLKRAQDAITQMRPYADRLNKMLVNILSNLEGGVNSPLAIERDVQNVAIAVVTSSKGLAGAFNTNIIKSAVAYLPVEKMEGTKTEEEAKAKDFKADYIFEPGKEELLNHLIPSILQTTFQKYVYDTHASEHGARMTAMDNATENAEELMKDLKVSYNKARQEAITKELAEIVGGAAALGG